jgi:hypothetical protein
MLLYPFSSVAHASDAEIPDGVKEFIGKISTEILNPLIAILFVVATFYFFYGVAKYLWNPESEEEREGGRRSMFWGIVGMFIMVSVFSIIKFIISSIGAESSLMEYV